MTGIVIEDEIEKKKCKTHHTLPDEVCLSLFLRKSQTHFLNITTQLSAQLSLTADGKMEMKEMRIRLFQMECSRQLVSKMSSGLFTKRGTFFSKFIRNSTRQHLSSMRLRQVTNLHFFGINDEVLNTAHEAVVIFERKFSDERVIAT